MTMCIHCHCTDDRPCAGGCVWYDKDLDGRLSVCSRCYRVSQARREVEAEIRAAQRKYPALNSPHEGYAVIAEELDELWSEVKYRHFDADAARREAIQVAATAIRFAAELTEAS